MSMDNVDWQRLEALFEAALEQPPEARTEWVARITAEQPELRALLERLLEADAGSDAIDQAVGGAARALLEETAAANPLIGERFGPYRIVCELGHGGMGRVFLGERDDEQYRGQVAIKLIASGGDRGLEERFRTERQLQANLHHPGIARVLDASISDDGDAYLVMEYVDGIPIDAHCAQQRLSLAARLRLVIALCEAVQHAHQNLVVHRDIKAANVLVTAEGVPKLLDFGIAKLIDPQRAGELALHRTTELSRVLTLESASPEQLRGEPASTATDVYGIGVLLYRLLTGRGPYASAEADPIALSAAILGSEAQRPSQAAIAQSDDARQATAFARELGMTPSTLARALRGDLDTVLLKALRKEPERRYASAAQFAEDLRRHLERQPVLARGDALGYILRRFVTRNAKAVAAAATGFVAVVALVGFYTAELAAERDRAWIEARRTEEVSTFMTGLFESSMPEHSLGERITARELLDLGAARIETDLTSEPAVQAKLMQVIGSAYASLGLYEPATAMLERGLTIRESVGGPADALLGDLLHHLGGVWLSQGAYDQSEALLQQALAVRIDVHGELHRDPMQSLLRLTSLHLARFEFDEAEATVDRADRIAKQAALDREAIAAVLTERGEIARRRGRFDEAVEHYLPALEIRETVSGVGHPATLHLRAALASALNDAARYDESEAMNRTLLEARRKLLPERHPAIAATLSGLSQSLKQQGRSAEAEPYEIEALEISRAVYPGDHEMIVLTLNNLANIRHDLRDLDGAHALHQESLTMLRRLRGGDHPDLANGYSNLAALELDRERYAQAVELYRQALELDRAAYGDDHPWISHSMTGMGNALSLLGQHAEAEAMLRDAVLGSARAAGTDHPQTAHARRDLGIALTFQGRCEEAQPLLHEALAGLAQVLEDEAWPLALTRGFIGGCLIALGSEAEGRPLLQAGYGQLLAHFGEEHRMPRQLRDLWPAFLPAAQVTGPQAED